MQFKFTGRSFLSFFTNIKFATAPEKNKKQTKRTGKIIVPEKKKLMIPDDGFSRKKRRK